MEHYDAIIIGSGLGGLACGATLSREGMKVRVLERHGIAGGCLQSFRRQGRMLDTGMHYVGSMAPGQILHQYFKYYGIVDRLQLDRLDPEAYDVIRFGEERYAYACGYDRFAERLAERFPAERAGIEAYCRLLQRVGTTISPELLRAGRLSADGSEYMGIPAFEAIAGCTRDPELRRVLAGTTGLHSRDRARTSFYEHAMIQHSYIESAWRFVGGTQHVADALAETIRRHGGEVSTGTEVTRLGLDGRKIGYVEVNGTDRLAGRYVVSAIHPAATFALLDDPNAIRPAFFRHVRTLGNSCGIFTTYLLMKPGSCPYVGSNYYLHADESDGWSMRVDYRGCNLPVVLVCMQPDPTRNYAEALSLLVPMPSDEWRPWAGTTLGHRGADYAAWKERYAQASIDFVARYFPAIRSQIEAVHTASPLTYRDYTATPDGSAYGIVKDCRNPLSTHLSVRTRIENLLLTGQNINVHGALGVCVSAAATCSALVGEEYLTKKIGNE